MSASVIDTLASQLRLIAINIRYEIRLKISQISILFNFFSNKRPRPHGLDSRLVVSLTSYPPRFNNLHWTIKCLLAQNIAADHVILWISESDKNLLPNDVISLKKRGLEIKFCKDIKSYKKIIPALNEYLDCFIVTADDDVCYSYDWLEGLVGESRNHPETVICHRAHKIKVDHHGEPIDYAKWELSTDYSCISPMIFPTGVGGVLYPPNCFYQDVCKEEIFMRLCPSGDDIWLFWMTRLSGVNAKKTRYKFDLITWRGSQDAALWINNVTGKLNDDQIKKMITEYGFSFFDADH